MLIHKKESKIFILDKILFENKPINLIGCKVAMNIDDSFNYIFYKTERGLYMLLEQNFLNEEGLSLENYISHIENYMVITLDDFYKYKLNEKTFLNENNYIFLIKGDKNDFRK